MSEIFINEPLTLGKILDKSINFIFKNILWITLLGFSIEFPQLIFSKWVGSEYQSVINSLGSLQNRLMSGLIYMILTPFLAGTVTLLLGAQFSGNSMAWHQAFGKTLKKLFPLLLLQLLVVICIVLGSILLVIPGIIVMCATACAIPAMMLENLGPSKAFDRSWELTKKSRLRIFGYFILSGLIMLITAGILTAIIAIIPIPLIYQIGILALLTAPLHALWPAITTLLYADFRIRKEALDLEQETHKLTPSNTID